jgi:hypothetical protein
MRDMASPGAAYGRRDLPIRLMQRLDLVKPPVLPATAQAAGVTRVLLPAVPARRRTPPLGAQLAVLAWFSLGVIASGAFGAGSLVGLRALAASETAMAQVAPWMSWVPWAKAAPAQPQVTWETAQIAIDRSERARAPLPLQVTGADDDAIQVVLQGLPAGVRPSYGTPLDGPSGSTWVLGPSGLDGLYLALDETAPEAFDFKISVSASPRSFTVGSIVQVRLVDTAPLKQAALPVATDAAPEPTPEIHAEARWETYRGMSDGPEIEAKPAPAFPPAAPRTASAARAKTASHPAQRRAAAPPAAQAATATGSWPEGASGLGAVPREPEEPSWWQMPPPSWSPFLVGQERP